jgi:hypothetical protein
MQIHIFSQLTDNTHKYTTGVILQNFSAIWITTFSICISASKHNKRLKKERKEGENKKKEKAKERGEAKKTNKIP